MINKFFVEPELLTGPTLLAALPTLAAHPHSVVYASAWLLWAADPTLALEGKLIIAGACPEALWDLLLRPGTVPAADLIARTPDLTRLLTAFPEAAVPGSSCDQCQECPSHDAERQLAQAAAGAVARDPRVMRDGAVAVEVAGALKDVLSAADLRALLDTALLKIALASDSKRWFGDLAVLLAALPAEVLRTVTSSASWSLAATMLVAGSVEFVNWHPILTLELLQDGQQLTPELFATLNAELLPETVRQMRQDPGWTSRLEALTVVAEPKRANDLPRWREDQGRLRHDPSLALEAATAALAALAVPAGGVDRRYWVLIAVNLLDSLNLPYEVNAQLIDHLDMMECEDVFLRWQDSAGPQRPAHFDELLTHAFRTHPYCCDDDDLKLYSRADVWVPVLADALVADDQGQRASALDTICLAFPALVAAAVPRRRLGSAMVSYSPAALRYIAGRLGTDPLAWEMFSALSDDMQDASVQEACDTILILAADTDRHEPHAALQPKAAPAR